jgi:hypothetical protein
MVVLGVTEPDASRGHLAARQTLAQESLAETTTDGPPSSVAVSPVVMLAGASTPTVSSVPSGP